MVIPAQREILLQTETAVCLLLKLQRTNGISPQKIVRRYFKKNEKGSCHPLAVPFFYQTLNSFSINVEEYKEKGEKENKGNS